MGTSDPPLWLPGWGWVTEMGIFQACLRCLPFPFPSQRPRGDQAPHQLPSPNARGRNRWHLWVSFFFHLLPSISGAFCLSIPASLPLWVHREVHGVPVCSCLFMCMWTRVFYTSFKLMSKAGPSHTSLCSNFPMFFIVSSKKKVEMCRVRKTCSIFLKEEKTGAANRLKGMKFSIPPGTSPKPLRPHSPGGGEVKGGKVIPERR